MPYKFILDKIKLPRTSDRRIKLTDEERREIRDLYFYEHLPIREIARRFEKKCSRRTIQMEIFPERRVRAREISKKNSKEGKYKPTKKSWAKIMREHRAYKFKELKRLKII